MSMNISLFNDRSQFLSAFRHISEEFKLSNSMRRPAGSRATQVYRIVKIELFPYGKSIEK